MKSILVTLMLMFTFSAISFAQNEIEGEKVNQHPEVKAPYILFVLQIPSNLENKETCDKFKGNGDSNLKVVEEGGMIKLLYTGTQITSAVEPNFIKSMNVLKGEKAKSLYPKSPEGGVIEMTIGDAEDLIKVYNAIKAS